MEEDPLLKTTQLSYSTVDSSPGLHGGDSHERRRSLFSWLSLRYGSSRKCVSSKAALLILLWSFVLGLWNGLFLNPDVYIKSFNFMYKYFLVGFGFAATVMCFFPLAGFLADTKYGRYKTVVRSLCLLLISMPLLAAVAGAILGTMSLSDNLIPLIIMSVFTSVFGFLVVVLSFTGVVGFTANVIQFGMDQLHDSPGEDRTLFIHWYVWIYYLSIFTGQLGWVLVGSEPLYPDDSSTASQFIFGFCILGPIPLAVIVVLVITLCLARRRRIWFLIEPGTVNPYKQVYRVTKFASQHKVPVNRSAFTYCEDEMPTGLDLAKDKYGGPFTTEQVEDVKAFYGITKVLLSFGVFFSLNFAVDSLVAVYSAHVFNFEVSSVAARAKSFAFRKGLFSPMLIVVCIPLYLCLLRPILPHFSIPMLKRIGLGLLLALLSAANYFSMDVAAHKISNSTICMFSPDSFDYLSNGNLILQDPVYLIFPVTLSSLSHMLIYPAVFEFICSQSPHSMKGLLIGLLYTIKGLFQLLATVLVIPFALGSLDSASPSCGFYYYLMNIVVGVLGFVWFVWMSKRYQFRERDEPSNIHRYAEEYYSNPQQEEGFDYSYTEI